MLKVWSDRLAALVAVVVLLAGVFVFAPSDASAASRCNGKNVTISQPSSVVNGVAYFNGTNGNDVISVGYGNWSKVQVNAKGGHDTICASTSLKNVIYAGSGNDWVSAGSKSDYIDIGSGYDYVSAWGGNDVVRAYDAHDIVDCSWGWDSMLGSGNPGYYFGCERVK